MAPETYRVTAPPPRAGAQWRRLRALLRRAERPLLLVGAASRARTPRGLVVQLAERHGIPMITAYGRNDAVAERASPLPRARSAAPDAGAPPPLCRHADVLSPSARGSASSPATSTTAPSAPRPPSSTSISTRARSAATIPWAVGVARRTRGSPCAALAERLARRRRATDRGALAGGRGRAASSAPGAARGGRPPRRAPAQASSAVYAGAAEGAAARRRRGAGRGRGTRLWL